MNRKRQIMPRSHRETMQLLLTIMLTTMPMVQSEGDQFCEHVAVEGRSVVLGPTQIENTYRVEWQAYFSESGTALYACENRNCQSSLQHGKANFKAIVEPFQENFYNYSLTIVNVSRAIPNMETSWEMKKTKQWNTFEAWRCKLQVRAIPKIYCQPAHFENETESVSMSCDVTTYPQALCEFQEQEDDNKIRTLNQSEIFQGPTESKKEEPVYYNTNCSMTAVVNRNGIFHYRIIVKTMLKDNRTVPTVGNWTLVKVNGITDVDGAATGAQLGASGATKITVTVAGAAGGTIFAIVSIGLIVVTCRRRTRVRYAVKHSGNTSSQVDVTNDVYGMTCNQNVEKEVCGMTVSQDIDNGTTSDSSPYDDDLNPYHLLDIFDTDVQADATVPAEQTEVEPEMP